MSRLKENLFDCGSADSYNVCEWASIDRLERGRRGGNIAALRAAVAAQAILTFDDKLQVPRDMADVPVMVQELTGSHYTTHPDARKRGRAEHVKIENGGLPQARYAALKNGTARAVAVMEPFISLGLKEGAHMIAASFYRGGEVISPDLTPEQRKTYYDAENRGGRPDQRGLLQVRPSRHGPRQGRFEADGAAARLRALQARRLLRRDAVRTRL